MLICPWNAYFVLKLARCRSQPQAIFTMLGLILTTLLILISHPFVAFWWLPFASGLLVIGSFTPSFNRRILETGVICIALAITFAAPYWLTLLQLKSEVADNPYAFALGGVDVTQRLYDLRNVLGTLSSPTSRMVLFWNVAAFTGFALTRRQPIMRYTALMCAIYLYMQSKESLWIWQMCHPVLKYMQYNERLSRSLYTMLYIGIIQLGSPLALLWIKRLGLRAQLCSGIAVMIITMQTIPSSFHLNPLFPTAPQLEKRDFNQLTSDVHRQYTTTGLANEFTPKHARPDKLPDRNKQNIPIAEIINPLPEKGYVFVISDSTSHFIRLELALLDNGMLQINQFYFPGWKIRVNGEEIHWVDAGKPSNDVTEITAQPSPDGLLLVNFPHPGLYNVEAFYDGPPGWQIRNAVMAVISIMLGVALWRRLRSPEPMDGTNFITYGA